ncbi:hypothetical protein FBEOM_2849 [Fusarium beomiforme]|uniref:Uncharacterized protein n=1 Tax=Fusarium beomiforme TaxID=44412 RepID=A0A9P5E2P8_9HYPO|nr:hypothetical protein FBEOM_2849 [Fusarium beomiforme]
MDRSRRMPQRRRPLGASASPTSTSEASFDLNPLTSPGVSHTNTTTTPQGVGGRRSTKPLSHAFTFSPPSSSRNSNAAKKRSTTMDNYPVPDEGEHGPKKGGHSLRKRARVDYTFEHIDDDVVIPNSTSSARGKKRRSEVNFDTDDFYANDSKRRGASMGADTPSNRRKNPTRKSSDLKAYHQAALQEDDNDVQDTIEVGAYYSDVDDSEVREAASNNSSPQNKLPSKDSPKKSPQNESTKDAFAAPLIDENQQQPQTKETLSAPQVEQISADKVSTVVEPTRTSIEEPVSQPTEPQPEKLPKVEPEPESFSTKQKSPAAEDNDELKPVAVSDAKSEPAATAVPDSNPVEVEPQAEAEAEVAPVSVPVPVSDAVPVPTIAPLPITVNENNKSESIHSPIVPASEPELVNGIAEVPTAKSIPQDPSSETLPSSIANTNIKEEATQHTNINQIPESPDKPSNQHQEDKMNAMDKMEIDPVQAEHPAQDVEMTDATPLDAQELVQEHVQEHIQEPLQLTQEPEQLSPMPEQEHAQESTPALVPAVLSPSASRALLASAPKSPAKPLKAPSPSPSREIKEPQQTVDDIPSPENDISNDVATPVKINGDLAESENVNNDNVQNNKDKESTEVPATADELPISDSPEIPLTQEGPATISSPAELKAPTPPPAETIETPASSAPSETKTSPQKPVAPRIAMESMPQPAPVGRWSHLKPYVDGEFVLYPEKKGQEDGTNDDATPEGKDTDMEPMVDDQDDAADGGGLEAPTPALNTPTRGSPVPDSTDPTAFNSPAPGGDDGDDADVSESQEVPERTRYYKYRKLRDPEEYISILENYEDMSTEDLYEVLEAVNVSMVQWQDEWNELGAVVDDYENSLRRRAADAKYEARTRNLNQHGLNYEEPEFAVKGYKARDKEGMNETRYLQSQDRIMAATYGFEYDPHPSKIGKQNPETQQVGIMTRGRSLRNQPRQTAKATETDEVVGKRQRKPVQLFDPATQDVSRSSTPVPPTRGGRRRKNANAEDEPQINLSVSFNTEVASDNETSGPKTRRKRGTRGKNVVTTDEPAPTPEAEERVQESPAKPTRRGRARPAVKYEEADPNEFVDDEPQEEEEEVQEKEGKAPVRRALVTLKLPRAYYNDVTPENEITDNGESRPTTASSEDSGHTVESSYSFRPKRQKRFRDDPNDAEESAQAPPRKKGKRSSGGTTTTEIPSTASTPGPSVEPAQAPNNRKIQKIKVVRSSQDVKNGGTPAPPPPPAATTPAPPSAPPSVSMDDGDDTPKDYKSMTKSEKMSASMKNRWANGNMAGAVEKRKATLAAKKAAQAAAEQRTGVVAPNKPKGKATIKRESSLKMQMQPDQPQMPPQQPPMMHQPPPMHPHQHELPPHHYHPHQHQHQHQHPPHPLHLQQQPPMHPAHPQHLPPPPPPPPHQGGNPPPPFMHGHPQHHSHGHSRGMPGMGYPY